MADDHGMSASRCTLVPPAAVKPSGRPAGSVIGGGTPTAGGPSTLQQRVMDLEQQLTAERQQHAEVRRMLQQTEGAVRSLEARTQHDAFARPGELDLARQATLRAQRGLDEALFEVQQRTDARRSASANVREQATSAATSPIATTPATVEPEADALCPVMPASETPPLKKRGCPGTRPLPELKPVRWWTPSFRDGSRTKS